MNFVQHTTHIHNSNNNNHKLWCLIVHTSYHHFFGAPHHKINPSSSLPSMAMYPCPPYYSGNYAYYFPPVQPPLAYVLANHFGPYGKGPVSAAGMQFLNCVAPNLRPLPQPYTPYGMPYGYIPPPPPPPPPSYPTPPPPPPPRDPPRGSSAGAVVDVRCHYDGEKHYHHKPYYHECCGGHCTSRKKAWRRHHWAE
ncbi:uncharacterized protein F4807DRAFT_430566 [Annulohypoxylon truncatum]|uniref:uncharacterized protein n=1 Tax=Annulohypoxylon truncatum TaxID=327061 RepID=UPI0020075388|nr:uncharacterized protein F4807DRAFT_430566 [Annulohypoxylon truncatum]KAI1208652.1 hypothetical protein F4807DRAFT_430566 [Annulohypoxylon truncatum]